MNLEQKFINTVRMLSAEAIEKAKSGHPGLPLGAAPIAYSLWQNNLKHSPNHSKWINRDRFILSAGHGSMLLYSLLHIYGYNVDMNEIKNFRQLGSLCPGHPEFNHTDGVDATTGPLGQGLSMAVGMAIAERHLAAAFNREELNLFDHYTFALCGDGCLMEGITNEASSLAGTLGLSKLIVLYDSNNITIEGSTNVAFREDVCARYEALGWNTIVVEDGTDYLAIDNAIKEAKKSESKPTLIKINTTIGYGSPNKSGKAASHGSPLGADELELTKAALNMSDRAEFSVDADIYAAAKETVKKNDVLYEEWNAKLESYKKRYPKEYGLFVDAVHKRIPNDYINSEEFITFEKSLSTRVASGEIINRLADKIPYMIGGSADLAPSNMTWMKNREAFSKENPLGTNLQFGVREHAMGAIMNGIALHGGLLTFGGTFFVFSDYLKPAMRMSALMELPVTYVLTHDSIGVGEDGPTHQPIEQLAMLRSIPNFITFRPCDAIETAVGWSLALESKHTPVALVLSRQTLLNLNGSGYSAKNGAYILKKENGNLDLILIASGSEVEIAIKSAAELEKSGKGVRVVSMPSMELFDAQSSEYKESVLPSLVRNRIAIEAAASFGWHKYVGLDGTIISIERFGASAPGNKLFDYFGICPENIVKLGKEMLSIE